jgi:hypothetical protein
LPPNVVSEGYECCTNGQFGNAIQFAGSARQLTNVTVTLSDWAYQSAYPGFGNASGFTVPLTLNLYILNGDGSVGALIASRTIDPLILWRPEPDAGTPGSACSVGDTGYTVSGNCYHGLAQNETFDFSGVTVPDQIVFGLAFDTETYGASPTGVHGPYDSLNFGLSTVDPTIGSDVYAGDVYRDGTYQRSCGTPGTFGQDCGWSPYIPAAEFDATVPEPATSAILCFALVALIAKRRRTA